MQLPKYCIFSIDNASDPLIYWQFVSWWAGMVKEGHFEVPLTKTIGAYKGETEFSFVADLNDFIQMAFKTEFVAEQESVLLVTESDDAVISYRGGRMQYVGKLTEVDQMTAQRHSGFTYFPEDDVYAVCVMPDSKLKLLEPSDQLQTDAELMNEVFWFMETVLDCENNDEVGIDVAYARNLHNRFYTRFKDMIGEEHD